MAKTVTGTVTPQWNTLHIFGYGETQLIGDTYNIKVNTADLTKAQAVIDNVYSFKPEGNPATKNYHAINTFNQLFSDWQTSEPNVEGWRVQYADLDTAAIDALVDEIYALQ
jgi:hypothetical protein